MSISYNIHQLKIVQWYLTQILESFVCVCGCCISDFDKSFILFGWSNSFFHSINVNNSRSWTHTTNHHLPPSHSCHHHFHWSDLKNILYLKHSRKWSVLSFQFPGISTIIYFLVNKVDFDNEFENFRSTIEHWTSNKSIVANFVCLQNYFHFESWFSIKQFIDIE